MKRRVILLELAAILLAGIAVSRPLRSQAQHGTVVVEDSPDVVRWQQLLRPEEQHAQFYLGHGFVVGGIEMEAGKYLVVHRKDAIDEATFFYRVPVRPGQLSAARQRCTPIEGAPVRQFTLKAASQPNGTSVVRSIQFPGSNEIHSFERAEVYLGHAYTIGGVPLGRGKYLVVHNTDRDDETEACLFVYRMPYHRGDEAVATAHCMPVEGPVAHDFTMRSTEQPDGSSLVRSIQFVGSTQVHTFAAGG